MEMLYCVGIRGSLKGDCSVFVDRIHGDYLICFSLGIRNCPNCDPFFA